MPPRRGADVGFADQRRLDEHYDKHGAEFGRITKQDYLRQAQLLRDAKVGGPCCRPCAPTASSTRFDRQTGAFIAFNPNGTSAPSSSRNDGERYYRRQAERRRMKPPPPPGPPDVAELRDLIDQWAEFTGDLERKDYTLRPRQLANDVDVRELILEALPMFSREEMGDHALKLDAGRQGLQDGTRDFKSCVWGHGTASKEKWTAAEELVVLPHPDAVQRAARRRAGDGALRSVT